MTLSCDATFRALQFWTCATLSAKVGGTHGKDHASLPPDCKHTCRIFLGWEAHLLARTLHSSSSLQCSQSLRRSNDRQGKLGRVGRGDTSFHVRCISNSDRLHASQQNDALCHKPTHAPQQNRLVIRLHQEAIRSDSPMTAVPSQPPGRRRAFPRPLARPVFSASEATTPHNFTVPLLNCRIQRE
jgi:hypothetical protein